MLETARLTFALRSRITAPVHCNQAANFFRSSMMIVQRTDNKLSESNTCSNCPHPVDCANVGKCLTELAEPFIAAKQFSRWMLPTQAQAVEAALRAGRSHRQITSGGKKLGPAICTPGKWTKHMAAYPKWGAEMELLAKANSKALEYNKGAHKRNKTHCKNGHPFDRVVPSYMEQGRGERRLCSICMKAKGSRGHMPPQVIVKQVKALMLEKRSISSFTKYGEKGFVLYHRHFTALRKENAEIGLIYADNIKIINSRGQIQRHHLHRIIHGSPAVQRRSYTEISSLVSRHLPGRDDVVQEIFEALLDKSLHPDDVRLRIDRFVSDQNRMFPTKYRKFGNDDLVSLDQVLFEDGNTTRGDTVSRGLWD
jgi:hypothetical protein